jgi:predicted  nucleic acid-binding Zn-ribbon protein
VTLRVEAAKEKFAALKKSEREHLAAEAELREPQYQTALFKGSYDEIWTEGCPACGCRAFMTGEQTGEDISDQHHDQHAIWEIVDREFAGEEFRCPTCDLSLMGSDEIDGAGLNYIHEDQQEREMEYEPDYGND